jgi:hypothetical protein
MRASLLPLLAILPLVACGDKSVDPTAPKLLQGDYEILNTGDIDDLRQRGGVAYAIGGSLLIFGSTVEDLSGLENLTGIGRSLEIRFNTRLTSLRGLEGLVSVGDSLVDTGIRVSPLENPSNKSQHVIEGLIVTDNPALASLQGLDSLQFVGGGFSLIFNEALTSLDHLGSLNRVRGSVDVIANPVLAGLTGLLQLERIEGYLEVGGNPLISSLRGLERLSIVEADLIVWFNDGLTSLDGLQGLETVGGPLTIDRNPQLPQEQVLAFVESLIARGYEGEAILGPE